MITTISKFTTPKVGFSDVIVRDVVPMSYAFVHIPAAICHSGN